MTCPISESKSRMNPQDQLIQLMSPWIAPLGYRIIHVEMQSNREKVLRIFIDFLETSDHQNHQENHQAIGIEDCVKVSRTLDTYLDDPEPENTAQYVNPHLSQYPDIAKILSGAFDLEVSSPGADRPLRSSSDFQHFVGRDVIVHTYRPLTPEEGGNETYQEKNPKQKNFKGTLTGLQGDRVLITLTSSSPKAKSKAKKKATLPTNSVEEVTITIPLPLISKANLEPQFDFESGSAKASQRSDERQ